MVVVSILGLKTYFDLVLSPQTLSSCLGFCKVSIFSVISMVGGRGMGLAWRGNEKDCRSRMEKTNERSEAVLRVDEE